MKKRIVGIMALSLVGAMMVTSLTGCGLQTKATDITVDDGDTIIVDQEDMETETESEVEENTEETDTDEITSSEVVGETTEESSDFIEAEDGVTYTEHEFFYKLDKLDLSVKEEIDFDAFTFYNEGTYELFDSVNLYGSKGVIIGYTKPNITVNVLHSSDEWFELYFENEDDANKYMLVKAKDFIAATGSQVEDKILFTAEDFINEFDVYFSQEPFEIVSKTDDMQYVEVWAVETSGTAQSWIDSIIYNYNLEDYTQFYIETLDKKSHDPHAIWFGIYYK